MHAIAQTFWHSSAHVLGEALEACFGVRLTIGPAVEEGFYYDCYMGDRTLTDAEKPALEKKIEQARQTLHGASFWHTHLQVQAHPDLQPAQGSIVHLA